MVLACGHPPERVRPATLPRTAPPSPPTTLPAVAPRTDGTLIESAASNVLEQPEEWFLTAWTPIGGANLYIHGGIERWLYTRADNVLTAARTLLPERIIAVGHVAGELQMIGSTGAIYSSTTLLGPIRRFPGLSSPPRHAAIGRQAFVAIASDQKLMRSTDLGSTWTVVAVPAAGLMRQVVLSPLGTGLAIAGKELLSTSNDGATWYVQANVTVRDDDEVSNDRDGAPVFSFSGLRFEGDPPKFGAHRIDWDRELGSGAAPHDPWIDAQHCKHTFPAHCAYWSPYRR